MTTESQETDIRGALEDFVHWLSEERLIALFSFSEQRPMQMIADAELGELVNTYLSIFAETGTPQ